MLIVVNGESKEVVEGISLDGLISELGVVDKVMAAAVNMQIIKKHEWQSHLLKDQDQVELLQFVGGG
jgi:sulfur carrier protein